MNKFNLITMVLTAITLVMAFYALGTAQNTINCLKFDHIERHTITSIDTSIANGFEVYNATLETGEVKGIDNKIFNSIEQGGIYDLHLSRCGWVLAIEKVKSGGS